MRGVWNVRAMPHATRAISDSPGISGLLANRIVPASGAVIAGDHVEVVVLPLPFGPIRPWILPGRNVEIDAIDRAHPEEAQDHAAQR